MKIIDCGYSGKTGSESEQKWSELNIGQPWIEVTEALSQSGTARPVQQKAIHYVLNDRKNLIVAAPTNGGKSLVGDLVLIQAAIRGGRSILVEPLRALAQEKYEKYLKTRSAIEQATSRGLEVQITTGDYRLENQQFDSPPTEKGQLVITTPERLDAILRNPNSTEWVNSITAICVDEAHLISDRRRGPCIEYILSFFKSRAIQPRIVLLSASLSDTSQAADWLSPCESIVVTQRSPSLKKQILDTCDVDLDDAILYLLKPLVAYPENTFLIFVYQTRTAVTLANMLCEKLATQNFAQPYHSKMSIKQRHAIRSAYESGETRCVVATTSLALGVNLPATHVIVKDLFFHGAGRVAMPQLLQMCGRAGRGDRAGSATLVFSNSSGWELPELAQEFRKEELPALTSSFQPQSHSRVDVEFTAICEMALKHLARFEEGQNLEQIESFFNNSFGGIFLHKSLRSAIEWLSAPSQMFVVKNKSGVFSSTSLGSNAIRSTLPLNIAAGVGQMIRDLLEIDAADHYLQQWAPLDHLTLLDILSDRAPSLRRFSEHLAVQIAGWMEASRTQKSLLYREWIRGAVEHSKAADLLGSLGVGCNNELQARSIGHLATFRSIVLYDRGKGIPASDLERRWGIENLSGVEEQWRDTTIWLLNAMARILEIRCFYYHLNEQCDATHQRIKKVASILKVMRRQLYGLQEHLKYCSPLGGLLLSIKRSGSDGIGFQSVRKIESAGIESIAELANWEIENYLAVGIQRNVAKSIQHYLRRRQA